jgi:hypothetical protein
MLGHSFVPSVEMVLSQNKTVKGSSQMGEGKTNLELLYCFYDDNEPRNQSRMLHSVHKFKVEQGKQ